MPRLVKEGGELVISLLKAVSSAADAFGPLKGPIGSAFQILELVQKFHANYKEWVAFGTHVAHTLAGVVYFLPEIKEQPVVVLNSLESLRATLDDICLSIEHIQKRSMMLRVMTFMKDTEKIEELQRRLDNASELYRLNQTASTGIDIYKLLQNMDMHMARIHDKISAAEKSIVKRIEEVNWTLRETSILNLLPYAKEASWSPDRVCLPHTRQALLEDIWTWINDPQTSRIFLLSGVAGSGKTAIAHSVAQRCSLSDSSIILSSFFFTLDKPERNSQLISTIVTDILKISTPFTSMVADTIEADRSLLSAPIARQFEELILNPSQLHPPSLPVVVIIDALDEGYSEDLLKLLRTKVHLLPKTFRVFLTSRSDIKIDSSLSLSESIHRRYVDLYTDMNAGDIVVYSRHRLREVAELRQLEDGWPEEGLLADFTKKAEGLFLWVATVVNFIQFMMDPKDELRQLIYDSNSHLDAGDGMSELYSTILERCNWRDRKFAEGYGMLVGAILAAKAPLSIRAWQSLHSDALKVPVRDILLSVGSLLSGLDQIDKPVRILHQSFRDFSISHHQRSSSPSSPPYTNIDVREHSERLALLCLLVLNKGLAQGIPGLGYLEADSNGTGIPLIVADSISDDLRYACSYWIDHVVDVGAPTTALLQELHVFLRLHLIAWMELSATMGRFRNLCEFRVWRKARASVSLEHSIIFLNADRCTKIQKLSSHFSDMNRREDALAAMEEVLLGYRELVLEDPDTFSGNLAQSLHSIAICFSDLGRRREALEMIQEAVTLRETLASEYPNRFKSDLAWSIHYLSVFLSNLGQREEALEAVQQCLALRRILTSEHPRKYNPDLAWSLHNLSIYLSDLGRSEEALEVVQEAVTLRRALAKEDSKGFNPDLARSLRSLAIYLYELGRSEEAVEIMQEVVALHRSLAGEHPKKYNSDVAWSLHNLSVYLSDLGRREQALKAIQEAVTIRQALASEYPKRFNPDLAWSLFNLSVFLSGLGRRVEALEAVQESITIRRALSSEHPKKFNPDLAWSLHNLSEYLSDLGRSDEALEVVKEAVILRRALASEYPTKFNPYLASSLHALSVHLSDLGQTDEALKVVQEAVTIRRALANEYPNKYKSDLAESLQGLSWYLFNLGSSEEAVEVIRESIAILGALASEYPKKYNPPISKSFHNLAIYLSRLGGAEEALEVFRKTVALRRVLVTEYPKKFNAPLAWSLYFVSKYLFDLGRKDEALELVQESVTIRRALASEYPKKFNSQLASSLHCLSIILFDLQRREEAISAAREAIEFQPLTGVLPTALFPQMKESQKLLD